MILIVVPLIALLANVAAQVFEPCQTPNKTEGLCRPLQTCSPIVKLIQSFTEISHVTNEVRDFIKQSQCKPGESWVCCAIPPTRTTPITTKRSTTTRSIPKDLPVAPECGIDSESKSWGAEVTRIDEFPWLIQIVKTFIDDPPDSNYTDCGGALINHRYVLTAAHCLVDLPPFIKVKAVRLGDWDTTTNPDEDTSYLTGSVKNDPFIDVGIEKIIVHENHNNRTKHNDIALLRLAQPITYTRFIKPVCLPLDSSLKSENLTGFSFDVSGWGVTEDEVPSTRKLKVNLNAYSNERCHEVYEKRKRVIVNSQICAGGEAGRDSCNGDSGGPLVRYKLAGNFPFYYIAGIVSFGPRNCGTPDVPGVYTRITEFMPWILKNIKP